MSDDGVIDWFEAIDLGIVQEINRQVLHPSGYSLQVATEPTGRTARVRRVGPGWALDVVGPILEVRVQRAEAFATQAAENAAARIEALGYLRQPLGDAPEMVFTPTAVDREAIASAVASAVIVSGLAGVSGDHDLREWACDALATAVAHVLRDLAVSSPDGGASWVLAQAPRPAVVDPALGDALSRGDHLCADVRRLQAESEAASKARSEHGAPDLGGELLPSEVADFESAAVAFVAARDGVLARLQAGESDVTVPPEMADAIVEMERLYALAQPGMRVHRGDPTAFGLWDKAVRPALRDAARDSFQRMSDHDRLMARELWPWENADWRALADTVGADLADARAAQADAERAMQEATQRTASLADAMKTITEALERKAAT